MQETPETIIGITSDLLKSLTPILQRNIDTLEHDPNPFLQHRIQQEIEHQKGLLQQMEEVKERLQDYLNAPAPDRDPDHDSDLRQDEELRRRSYPPGGSVGVTMFGTESGTEQIRFHYASDTFAKAIEKVGVEDVKDLNLISRNVPLVGTVFYPNMSQKEVEGYYVVTSSNTSRKIRFLNIIADRLNVDLIADQFNEQ